MHTASTPTFGNLLKDWRQHRRFSQLQLALESDVSARHISFLETGRAKPSKDMVLKLATCLLLPKRDLNQALLAAGYAPLYTELDLQAPDLQPVLAAITHMIERHLPYPALVLNHEWDVVQTNSAAQALWAELGFTQANLLEALIAADQPNSPILNWQETAAASLLRLHYEIYSSGGSPRLQKLAQQLQARLPESLPNVTPSAALPAVKLRAHGQTLALFSVIAQLSTVQDVNVSELKVELLFPADAATQAFYQQGTA